MPRKRKTWREKLEKDVEPKVVDTPKGRVLVPKPLDVDAQMRRIEVGRIATQNQIRDRLARDFDADST